MMPSQQPGAGGDIGPTMDGTVLRPRRTMPRHRRTVSRHHSRISGGHMGRISTLERDYPEDVIDTMVASETDTWEQLDAVKALTASLDVKRKTRLVRRKTCIFT